MTPPPGDPTKTTGVNAGVFGPSESQEGRRPARPGWILSTLRLTEAGAKGDSTGAN